MLYEMMKCKIHRATITDANLAYNGSLALCPILRERAGLLLNEKVLIVNNNNGARLETYILPGEPGEVCLNGAAARLGLPGDEVIVIAFVHLTPEEAATHEPTLVFVNEKNEPRD